MGGSKKQTVGYRYYLGEHMVLCHGPIDNISRIEVDERVAWEGVNTGSSITINAPGLFGGNDREGGISGTVDIDMGDNAQGQNSYLLAQLGSLVPAFRGVVSAVLRGCYLGNNPYLKPWSFRGQRIYLRQDGIAQWYSEKAGISSRVNWNDDLTSYADTTALLAAWPETDVGNKVTWTLQPHPVTGTPSIRVVWAGGGGPLDSYLTRTVTGLTPGKTYIAHRDLYGFGPGAVTPQNGYVRDFEPEVLVADGMGRVFPKVFISGGVSAGAVTYHYDNLNLTELGGLDMNPAHIIRETLTDPDWGMGYTDDDIDDVSFAACADTLYEERMGMSLLWDRQIVLEEFIKEVARHIDAALFVSRRTGKFTLKLIRDDYDPDDLIVFSPSNITKINNPSKPTFGELSNSVTVVYWNSVTGNDASVSFTDTAMVQMQGQPIGTTIQYPGFTAERNAIVAARRDLKALSTSYLSCTIYTNQDAKDLNIGDTFKLTWPLWKVENLIMRVTGMSLGDSKSKQIKITCTQDIFSTPTAQLVQDPGTVWVDPSGFPSAAPAEMAAEINYYELAQTLGQSDIDLTLSTNPEIGYVMAAAAPPPSAVNARIWTDDSSGYEDSGSLDFCPYAELSTSIDQLLTVLPITGLVNADQIEIGSTVQIGGGTATSELCRVDAVDAVGGTVTVGRGCHDTPPLTHASGTPLFFWDLYNGFDPSEYLLGETIGVKVTPASGLGQLDIADAAEMTVVMGQRAFKPYAPGQFKINDEYYPAGPLSGPLTVTWVDRDRLQQTAGSIYDHTLGPIGPESGTTYRLRGYVDDVLEYTAEPVTSGAEWTPSAGGTARVEVHAKRDGVYSLRPATATFAYISNALRATEENDDSRDLEENDDTRKLED